MRAMSSLLLVLVVVMSPAAGRAASLAQIEQDLKGGNRRRMFSSNWRDFRWTFANLPSTSGFLALAYQRDNKPWEPRKPLRCCATSNQRVRGT